MTQRTTPPTLLALTILFGLGALVGMIVPREARADQARAEHGELIALTTAGARGEELLILIDPARQYLSTYRVDGRGITLVAGREYVHDHPAGVFSWYQREGKELTPELMAERIRQARK